MDFAFTEEQLAIRASVARICKDYGDDYWLARDRDGVFPTDFFNAFARSGYLGATYPVEYGGSGLKITEGAIIMHEIGKLGAAACTAIHINIFGPQSIVKFGTDEQKRRFLPPVAAGTDRPCFGVTEPNAGLDTTHIQTFARREGNKYIVNGRKVWTSSAQTANKIMLLARTTPYEQCARPTDGMTLFYTDLDRNKVDVRLIEKMGRKALDSNEVFIDGLEIPVEDRIGEEGKGFACLLHSLNPERIVVAAGFQGAARSVLERAVKYAGERIVFGRPIGQNQSIQHPLADVWINLEAAELMLYKAAHLYDTGQPCGAEANAVKYLTAEVYSKAAERAVRTHGGFGYAKEFHVERYYREAILPMIAPVSQELVLCYIAEKVLGLPKSY
jgi:acyl-CoA dehydrogenase